MIVDTFLVHELAGDAAWVWKSRAPEPAENQANHATIDRALARCDVTQRLRVEAERQ